MTLFQFAQMARIVPMFEWSCFNYPNLIKAVGICPNVSKCMHKLNEVVVYYSNWSGAVWSSAKSKKVFEVPQKWIKLFEVTQNWIKMLRLARIWMELLLFGRSWFSLLEFTWIFPIYGNIFNFTQIWLKLSQFAQISLRLLKYTQMILILSKFE